MSEGEVVSEVAGYLEDLSYQPGSTVRLHASGDGPAVVRLARLHAGADAERASTRVEHLDRVPGIEVTLRSQEVRQGSYVVVNNPWSGARGGKFLLQTHLHVTRPEGEHVVADWVWDGLACMVGINNETLTLLVRGDDVTEICLPIVEPDRWSQISVEIDPGVQVTLSVNDRSTTGPVPSTASARHDDSEIRFGSRRGSPCGEFDGCIDTVTCSTVDAKGDPVDLAVWDMGVGNRDATVLDRSPNQCHGEAIGVPVRGVPGPTWRCTEIDPRLAPDEFDAIHLHSDDLEDVGWPVTAEIMLPADLSSGAYAITIESDAGVDHVPFFVRSPADHKGSVAFLVSTFTYLAYANADLGDRIDYIEAGISGRDYSPGERDHQIQRNPVVAGSLYDVHRDGSGRCFSTMRRPIFNFRADFVSAVQQAPRHLGADLLILEWLRRQPWPVDVITDHDLHREGSSALEGYDTVVTSSHPEYVSTQILDALDEHLGRGGNLMYLGGNGFYWVTTASDDGTVIECRRGNAATRTWDSPAGQTHHTQTGEPGGLWRHRGRPPNALVGVGMTSQGWDERASAFRTDPAVLADESAFSWIVEGMEVPERFGDRGLVMNGASGDELDRWDPECGSPRHAQIIATSEPHSRHYMLVHEDLLMSETRLGGDVNDKVRSDVVWFETGRGGAVFSVGSISWAGAMGYANFSNDTATMCRNVLSRMMESRS